MNANRGELLFKVHDDCMWFLTGPAVVQPSRLHLLGQDWLHITAASTIKLHIRYSIEILSSLVYHI